MKLALLILLCVIIGIIPAYFSYRSDKKKTSRFFWIPSLCRFLAFSIIAALLLLPTLTRTSNYEEKPVLVLLQDESSSMLHSLEDDSVLYRQAISSFVADLSEQYSVYQYGFGQHLQLDSLFTYRQSYTDFQQATSAAMLLHKAHYLTDIVLISDGIQNLGGSSIYLSADKPLQLHTIGVGDSTVPIDAAVGAILYNKTVNVGSEFEVILDLEFDKLDGKVAKVQIFDASKMVYQQDVAITSSNFVKSLALKLKAGNAGVHKYKVVIEALSGEQHLVNNTKEFVVEVTDEKIKVLLCTQGAHPDLGAIKRSIEQLGPMEVQTYDGTGAMPEVASYQLAIIFQTPTYLLQNASWKMIPKWFILGTQTNATLFNQMQNGFEMQNANGQIEVTPVLNPSFGAFRVADGLLNASVQFPPLAGVYATLKPKKAVDVLFYKQMGQVKTSEPLWAFALDGQQSVAVTFGEGLWKWRMANYRSDANFQMFDYLVESTIQAIAYKSNEKPLKLFIDKQQYASNETFMVNAAVKNKLGQLDNSNTVLLELWKDNKEQERFEMDRLGSNYQQRVGPLEPGNYSLNAAVQLEGVKYTASQDFYIDAVSIEDRRKYSDYELLMQMASANNGTFQPLSKLAELKQNLLNNNANKTIIKTKEDPLKLIDIKLIFGILLLVFILEWIFRKYIIN